MADCRRGSIGERSKFDAEHTISPAEKISQLQP